jgi:hypothetical protein
MSKYHENEDNGQSCHSIKHVVRKAKIASTMAFSFAFTGTGKVIPPLPRRVEGGSLIMSRQEWANQQHGMCEPVVLRMVVSSSHYSQHRRKAYM